MPQCFTIMNNDNNHNTIQEFDVNLICDFFLNTNRQGPGSPEATLKALSFINNLTVQSLIADLGCGTGGQTMVLAQHTPGSITGLDFFPEFIECFNRNAEKLNLQDRVKGVVGSMDALSFEKESLDLIWSEGAIYNIGFERGLNEWRNYLKPGGYLIPVATFILPENCWTEHYYVPQAKAKEMFIKKYAGNKTAEKLMASICHEAELYSKYKEYYGYAFFIAKKINPFQG